MHWCESMRQSVLWLLKLYLSPVRMALHSGCVRGPLFFQVPDADVGHDRSGGCQPKLDSQRWRPDSTLENVNSVRKGKIARRGWGKLARRGWSKSQIRCHEELDDIPVGRPSSTSDVSLCGSIPVGWPSWTSDVGHRPFLFVGWCLDIVYAAASIIR